MDLNQNEHQRIQDIFSTLNPVVAKQFVHVIEAAKQRGKTDVVLEFIEPYVRNILRNADNSISRKATALRAFCTPFETFLINHTQQNFQPGRISRQSISPVWNWLKTDLLPETIPELVQNIQTAAEHGDKSGLNDLHNQLYSDSSSAIQKAFQLANNDNRLKKKYKSILGSRRLFRDLNDMTTTLEAAKAIRKLRRKLPQKIGNLNNDQLPYLNEVYRSFLNTFPQAPHLATGVIMAHLSKPAQILRIATNALGTNELHIIAQTPFGSAIDMLLYDLESFGRILISELDRAASADVILAALGRFYTLLDGFILELEFAPKGDWGRRITALRIRVAEALEKEIEKTPHLLMEFAHQNTADPVDKFSDWLQSDKQIHQHESKAKHQRREKAARVLKILDGCRGKLDHLPMNLTIQRVDLLNRNFLSCLNELNQPDEDLKAS